MDITLTSPETAHTELLTRKILAEIASEAGWMPFSRYMEMALYEPGMGYYSAGAHKLGAGGDFTTAPELSPLFGAAMVSTLLPILEGLKAQGLPTHILEFGAGTGKLAESILTRLHDLGFSLDRYDILEISPDLAQRQEARLTMLSERLQLSTQYQWLGSLPNHFKGIILANEVLDAMPCDVIIYQNGFWYQRGVAVIEGKLTWATGKLVEQSLLPEVLLTGHFSEGYVTELHPSANSWMRQVAQCLDIGLFLTFDYGFPENEYYHPQRLEGTLMAHHRHHAIQDPFHLPGLSDVTTHVEWSQIGRSALVEQTDDVYLSNQASYLLDAGISDLALEIGDPSNPETFLPISNALQKLLSEAEMGELFKVFAFTKNLNAVLPGHTLEDLPGLRGRNRF
ncbi:class I SAM-dependent methyltransferase [Polynucleobacter sp. CS-Odin-A6]|uniref:class I SAM-dependent methyltransferase n=1 Tax=Polynucleobacter sp. CS-Odin-A6 TaxID=2689106 RepID=UPI001C0CE0A1|nr:SAM-dependent methyltransferase [Polynucleobacter sp. CS-Odin-A6]MBU3620057.1 SAM-dependent methyltransferase [Polynucleobacter sp. CS-Odin-A6]